MDLQFLIFAFPAGVILCFQQLRDEHVFVIIYAIMASYFAGVMVRLMLTLTPVVCVASAITLSNLLDTYLDPHEPSTDEEDKQAREGPTPSTASPVTSTQSRRSKKAAPSAPSSALSEFIAASASPSTRTKKGIFGIDVRLAVLINTLGMLFFFVFHCTWVTSTAYSSPSVVLASQNPDGSQHIIDDFRAAYYWLRQNTPENAVVMSWWDYGYQIAGMADRATLVDNNTWNNS
jgi:dolichyl-diphosphooligosaccharide--protein glycosyltransferase